MRPGVAKEYLQEVVKQFEAYAQRSYVPALCDVEADTHRQIAGARFVATREVADQEGCLRELLDTPRRSPDRTELDASCVEALLRTTDDELKTARYLAWLASDTRKSSRSQREFERALAAMGPTGIEAILQEFADETHDATRVRLLVRLLVRTSRVAPPVPVRQFVRLAFDERLAALAEWRRALVAAGRLGE